MCRNIDIYVVEATMLQPLMTSTLEVALEIGPDVSEPDFF